MRKNTLKSSALVVVALIVLLGLIGCSTGNNNIEQKTFDVGDGVSFKMNKIAEVTGGSNKIGDNSQRNNDERPVQISTYMIAETEVTQELWNAIMGNNPSHFQGTETKKKVFEGEIQAKRPVEMVSWYDAITFCNKLTEKIKGDKTECVYYSDAEFKTIYEGGTDVYMNIDKKGFRLPTESEWEWAAKGGTEDKYAGTNEDIKLAEYAWYSGNPNTNSKTHEVKKLKPNGYGLYDMSGNVWEWNWDCFADITGGSDLGLDYTGAKAGACSNRVLHGGGWLADANYCVHAYRLIGIPDVRNHLLGLRLACRP